ncbi:GGDEF domain-containing protein [Paracoccus sp. MBLB3053]|uniref:diguanylate cyclase n=1 Tax=Paracoccus aurantius TaxID=3073814 RepID=A0ABU2HT14_9RHOB|nr:GGDEF domain-containing protein [Paracoccus sp. MBLB3053]MDS9468183.1 GGDEF domain-containing protein [Paracoccus sp. MBLB3053]
MRLPADLRSLLDRLMPMHLCLAGDGSIVSTGRTLRKLIGPARSMSECLHLDLPAECGMSQHEIGALLGSGRRLVFRTGHAPCITLIGHGASLHGGTLISLGFGASLVPAIESFGLTSLDFSPADLTMEFLFLHEANQAVMRELARLNRGLEEAREAAEVMAHTDPLTGLLNRRGFELALAGIGRKASLRSFALAHLDLDNFKEVNDRHGHAAGDEILIHVSQALRAETRASDRLARVGGDEFLLLLSGPVSREQLDGFGHRLIARIREPLMIDHAICRVSASIGFSLSEEYDTIELSEMLADADAALYEAKETGRNSHRFAALGAFERR